MLDVTAQKVNKYQGGISTNVKSFSYRKQMGIEIDASADDLDEYDFVKQDKSYN